MPAPKVAFFGGNSHFSEEALRAVARECDVVAAVVPASPRRGLHSILRRLSGLPVAPSLRDCAANLGIPVIETGAGEDDRLRDRLRSVAPDLHCIALYPRKLATDIVGLASLGAINAHPSLLPRHRGALPLFWTYHADDRVTGVTVHYATDRVDAGDIILQEAFELPRGHPVGMLDAEVTARAAPLLTRAVKALADGDAPRRAQVEAEATYAPVVRPGDRMVDFASWDVERVWHFLRALAPTWCEPLVDDRGAPASYEGVEAFERTERVREPGSVEKTPSGWRLHCRGGTIALTGRARAS